MNVSKPISSSISGVEFSALLEEEIKALSVKRIVNPTTFDNLNHPVPGGLYDTALGAFADNPCTTCNLNRLFCPGHCGHIELPVPVYHPNYLEHALRLLRAQCVFCLGFRMHKSQSHLYTCMLKLTRYGLLEDAHKVQSVSSKGSDIVQDGSSDSEEDTTNDMEARDKFTKRAISKARRSGSRTDWTQEQHEAVGGARRALIRDFMKELAKCTNCRNCGAKSYSYRKDRFIKVFRKALSAQEQSKNAQAGRKMPNPMAILNKRRTAATMTAVKDKGLTNGHIDEAVADLSSPSPEEEGDDVNMSDSGEDVEEDAAAVVTAAVTAESGRHTKAKLPDQKDRYVSQSEVHALLTLLFEQEHAILSLVYGGRTRRGHRSASADMFFITTLLVPPNKFRPEAHMGSKGTAEAAANKLYIRALKICQLIGELQLKSDDLGRIQQPWVNLQCAVNGIIDKEKDPGADDRTKDGLKQKLEKKEGLLRHNMMGKRVNFAARTVISPDPNIETNEIGVPPVFAKKLTYPEPVASWNYDDLHRAVLHGPDTWPGATAIETENGRVINLRSKSLDQRVAIANQLMAPSDVHSNGARGKKVHRHLNNGDIVLMNRQPTLHKPSMMAHRARVLPSERTLRMHYANCNSYNADFDGDEMNMHFPQNEMARAEATTIADTDHQYLSATAGNPLRGLIQDHISISVQLTKRDTFFTREQYHQLLYASLRPENGHTATGRLVTMPPAIWKPIKLWTGKQIVSSVLENIISKSHNGLTLKSQSSTSRDHWGRESEEQDVVFDDGYLAQGILDKRQVGPSKGGFVHAVYEAYGHATAGRLLSVLSRLLTKMLHTHAFSCGVQDLVLTSKGEQDRSTKLKDIEKIGLEIATKYVSLHESSSKPTADDPELAKRLESVLRDDSKQKVLDDLMKSAAADLSSSITKVCLPGGLVKPFPKNQMQAMTVTGAKGSNVNANLISCNLGSQVLEGRRVPTMVSGKTLPSFKPFDTSLRAGGYVSQRFLTGIRPQEYFFHAMGGREGLIDTAVKTSHSGYLQRCLVKGLEGLRVEYDTSVREADGTMVQFLYGEDGLDVPKATFLNDYRFAAQNFHSLVETMDIKEQYEKLNDHVDEIETYMKDTWRAVKKAKATGEHDSVPDPALSQWRPGRYVGSMSEKVYAGIRNYEQANPDGAINDRKRGLTGKVSRKNFDTLMAMKYLNAVVEPGEAVGVIAAQSIGEPSTQMTLNTFHLAGHSAKNVTLGIPRLREIVMTASTNISTPAMTLRVIDDVSRKQAFTYAKGLSRLTLAEVVDSVKVTETVGAGKIHTRGKVYNIKLQLFPRKEYAAEYAITQGDVLETIERKFIPQLQALVRRELAIKKKTKRTNGKNKSDALPEVGRAIRRTEREKTPAVELDADGLPVVAARDVDAEDDGDGDVTNAREKGNRTEGAGYGARDEEDEQDLERAGVRDESPDDDDGDKRDRHASVAPSDVSGEEELPSVEKGERAAVVEERIKSKCEDVSSFDFDYARGETCEFSLEYEADSTKLLMLNLVESCCRNTVIQDIPGLKTCVAATEKVDDPFNPDVKKEVTVIYTEGVNVAAVRDGMLNVVDPNYIYCNSIHAMLQHFGVEAARGTIVREMSAVFDSHGISVDNRHLNLIADVMTRGGSVVGFNRHGMKNNTSPFMKMSFESTVNFLNDAVLTGEADELRGPSARIVTGRLGRVGTGMVDVLMPFKKLVGADEKDEVGSDDSDADETFGGARDDGMLM